MQACRPSPADRLSAFRRTSDIKLDVQGKIYFLRSCICGERAISNCKPLASFVAEQSAADQEGRPTPLRQQRQLHTYWHWRANCKGPGRRRERGEQRRRKLGRERKANRTRLSSPRSSPSCRVRWVMTQIQESSLSIRKGTTLLRKTRRRQTAPASRRHAQVHLTK